MLLLLFSMILLKKEKLLLCLTLFTLSMFYYQPIWSFHNILFMDKMSFLMIMLTVVVGAMMMGLFMESHVYAFFCLIFVLVISFLGKSMLLFYIFFELSILPIFVIIFYKGKQYERLSASLYLMIYTLLASFPFLFYIINMKDSGGVWMMEELVISNKNSLLLTLSYVAFLTKLPIFFLHLWLPKAHVEAPVYGSMILAGVMLKLGTYGLIKFIASSYLSKPTLPQLTTFFIYFSIISGMCCLFSSDLKVLVAFSSVSHMTFLASSMNIMNMEASSALLINAISHGLISSNLFFVLNVVYERTKSRSIFLSKSWVMVMNSWVLLLTMSNFSSPPFISFFSEILLLMSYLTFSEKLLILSGGYLMITTIYSLYIFYCMKTNNNLYNSGSVKVGEWSVMVSLIFFSLISVGTLDNFEIML